MFADLVITIVAIVLILNLFAMLRLGDLLLRLIKQYSELMLTDCIHRIQNKEEFPEVITAITKEDEMPEVLENLYRQKDGTYSYKAYNVNKLKHKQAVKPEDTIDEFEREAIEQERRVK